MPLSIALVDYGSCIIVISKVYYRSIWSVSSGGET